MGKTTGFLEYNRNTPLYKPVEERLKNYKEFLIPLSDEELQKQGARCMDCGIPYCHSMGCPIYNLIPEWNDMVYNGRWREAYERLEMTNNFPEVTGRVCPAPCETSCTLSINEAPVSIKNIEYTIIEKAFAEGWVVPRPPKVETGKKVAVIGSGPAGLAAAQQLRRAGNRVTIFEKDPKMGGLLRYGIPDFKLDKSLLDRRLDQMAKEGVAFETDVTVGVDISARYLMKSYDAVLITIGAGTPRDLPVEGREIDGVHFAMDFLTPSNMSVDGLITENERISAKDKTVLVIGGGDTGSDCVGTSNRQGAKKVYQFEIMPKPKEWHKDWNFDWPYWPQMLRTSSSHEEGCLRDWAILTNKFTGENGKVTKGHFSRVTWDFSGERPQFNRVESEDFELEVDLVLLAMGFVHVDQNTLVDKFELELTEQGNILVDESYATSKEGVFAAGDATTGASLVVRAINRGREAAKAIDTYLQK